MQWRNEQEWEGEGAERCVAPCPADRIGRKEGCSKAVRSRRGLKGRQETARQSRFSRSEGMCGGARQEVSVGLRTCRTSSWLAGAE